jgi:hypothetical protein
MPKVGKFENDRFLRENVFAELFDLIPFQGVGKVQMHGYTFHRINDRQWGIILTDKNGDHRYIRVNAVVADLHDDMTAEELMESEIEAYNQKQADKAEKLAQKEKKIARDKARREAEKAKAEAKAEDSNQFLPYEVTY